jgi:hypothetical protein
MIWARADDATLQSMSRMPAGKRVDDVNPLANVEIVYGALPKTFYRPKPKNLEAAARKWAKIICQR